ncbi:hypothetical protein PVL30_000931 [Lodderomyces elongisporus]|uniref:uncharacterized protein n=1 Tax=Lodderomyces elongisporus TaxID=36914 RepID=UPI002923693A|nr:uncharacterized protein PVL30_000931 [Lodderomyces elongisporus]WLF77221.1 hypothetical protein PVL30_000931 [Lodderomyces elongisporus]
MIHNNAITVTLEAATTFLKRADDTTSATSADTAMPTLTDANAYTTPSVTVPPNDNNPFIIRQHNPSGTVFIAVGAIVGSILLGFILYHLIVSISASRLAKKTSAHDRTLYEKYQSNNNNAYGFVNMTPTTTANNYGSEYTGNQAGSVSKFPLLSTRSYGNFGGSQVGGNGSGVGGVGGGGDTSTIYQSDVGGPTSKHDLTKMFISPTAEVMQQKRYNKSVYNPSLTNLPFGSSATNLTNPNPATNRHSQLVPNLYINNESNNSEYSLAQSQVPQSEQGTSSDQNDQQDLRQQQLNTVKPRQQLPSMYLEDLIDKN